MRERGDGPLATPHIQTRTRRPKDTQMENSEMQFSDLSWRASARRTWIFLPSVDVRHFHMLLMLLFLSNFCPNKQSLGFVSLVHILFIYFCAPLCSAFFALAAYALALPHPIPLQSMRLPKLYVIIGIYNFFCRSLSSVGTLLAVLATAACEL